mmetsp:Transcript_7611/g.19037  ORF Transcript_7611/g.19037 Transcript_7611/m.19037 type:complete len:257 (-) Transcript_7611:362-1132(-)
MSPRREWIKSRSRSRRNASRQSALSSSRSCCSSTSTCAITVSLHSGLSCRALSKATLALSMHSGSCDSACPTSDSALAFRGMRCNDSLALVSASLTRSSPMYARTAPWYARTPHRTSSAVRKHMRAGSYRLRSRCRSPFRMCASACRGSSCRALSAYSSALSPSSLSSIYRLPATHDSGRRTSISRSECVSLLSFPPSPLALSTCAYLSMWSTQYSSTSRSCAKACAASSWFPISMWHTASPESASVLSGKLCASA